MNIWPAELEPEEGATRIELQVGNHGAASWSAWRATCRASSSLPGDRGQGDGNVLLALFAAPRRYDHLLDQPVIRHGTARGRGVSIRRPRERRGATGDQGARQYARTRYKRFRGDREKHARYCTPIARPHRMPWPGRRAVERPGRDP
jgi:hypothetical protein